MNRVWLIARKDLKEGFGQRSLMVRAVAVPVLLAVFYGVFTGLALRKYQANPHGANVLGGIIVLWGAMVAVLGTMAGGMVAAQSIALERVQHTLESLLATPATDREIFAGKVVAAIVPAVVGGYAMGALYYVVARLLSGVAPVVLPAVALGAKFILAVLPLVAGAEVAGGVLMSARCGTVTGAAQLSSLVTLPLIAAVTGVAYKLPVWPQWVPLATAGGLAVLIVALVYGGAKVMGREEIMARLD